MLHVMGPAGVEDYVHGALALFADLALELLPAQVEDETLWHLPADLSLLIPDGARAGEASSGVAPDLQRSFRIQRSFRNFPPVSRALYPALGPTLCLCHGGAGSRFVTSPSSRHCVACPCHRAIIRTRPRSTFAARMRFNPRTLPALRLACGLLPARLPASDASCQSQEREYYGGHGPVLAASQRHPPVGWALRVRCNPGLVVARINRPPSADGENSCSHLSIPQAGSQLAKFV